MRRRRLRALEPQGTRNLSVSKQIEKQLDANQTLLQQKMNRSNICHSHFSAPPCSKTSGSLLSCKIWVTMGTTFKSTMAWVLLADPLVFLRKPKGGFGHFGPSRWSLLPLTMLHTAHRALGGWPLVSGSNRSEAANT